MVFDVSIVRSALDDLSREQLVELIVEQARQLHQKNEQLKQLQEQNRAAHRPAAPHARAPEKRQVSPKRPGRKGGHQGCYRLPPTQIDETLAVPLSQCPHCAAGLDDVRPVVQYIEDLPEVRPWVQRVITYRGRCPACGPVSSRHPVHHSQAVGAAGTQLGANALALAAELIYDFGLRRRKVSRLLAQRFGLSITPSGLQQAATRLARRLRPRYEALKARLKDAAVVHSDETSWYVGTPGGEPRAWLWVFCHDEATVYRVERERARSIITETLGADFSGVLVSDCLNIYDDATPVQHKCYSHHLKAISAAIDGAKASGLSTTWLNQMRQVLKTAMVLKSVGEDLDAASYQRYCRHLESYADQVFNQVRGSPWDQRVWHRLQKQRDHLFVFLYHDGVEATNNLAERQLRPAVITRKVMCGNRSAAGARTWEVLASLSATARQRGTTLADYIVKELRGQPLGLLPR